MTVRMLQRRGTASQWNSVGGTVVLQPGEVGVNTTDNSFKIGDGESVWTDLEYHYPDDINELKYVQLAGGNTIQDAQVFSGTVDINGLLSITADIDIDADLTISGVLSSRQINVNNNKIVGLADPVSNTDAVNKGYVDNAIAGLAWKEAVHLIAHGTGNNVALTGNTNTLVIDGHPALVQADSGIYRILLTAQTTASENGIYVYNDNGTTYTLTRSSDADSPAELTGSSVYVQEGTAYGTSSWVQSNYNIDSFDDQVWVQFSGAALINDGAGLLKNGNTLSVIGTADRITVTPDNVDIASNYVGQTSITTLGTITSGQWNAEKISIEKGGTGATTAADARTNLGLTSVATASYGTTSGTVAEGNHTHNDIYYTKILTDEILSGYVHTASSSTISGTLTANNYNIPVSAETSNTIDMNFSAGTGLHTRTVSGNIVITGSQYAAGTIKTLIIRNTDVSPVERTLTFPSGWVFLGTKPASIPANKVGVLTVTCTGSVEGTCVAGWAVQN